MIQPKVFSSWLGPHFERFVAIKHAGGAKYSTQEGILVAFDRFVLETAPRPPLRIGTVLGYPPLHRNSPRTRENVISVIWQAVDFSLRHGAEVEPLPERPPKPPRHFRLRPPRIVSQAEVVDLIAAARALLPADRLRPATMATLIGLLYTTGLRIGEALSLNVGHFNRVHGVLTVVEGKFGKSRELPLRATTAQALARYIEDPRRPIGRSPGAPVFVSGRKRRLSQPTVRPTLRALCEAAGIPKPWPRPHDFRHSFAIGRIATWYDERKDVDSLLPILSTYLGHCSVENTRRYLTANGVLLERAAALFANQTKALDEVSQ